MNVSDQQLIDDLDEAFLDREPVLSGIKLQPASYGTKRLVRRAAKYIPAVPEQQPGESDEAYAQRVKPARLEAGIQFLETWLTIHAVSDLDKLEEALEDPSRFRKLVTRTMMLFSEADLEKASKWMNRQLDLEKKTAVQIVDKPRSSEGREEETPPPNC